MARHAAHAAPVPAGRRRRRRFWTAVMWVAIAVFVGALAYLGSIVYSYWSDSHRYDEIAQDVFTPADAEEEAGLAGMTVDWDALRAINPEVVAWIYVPDTPISYPVCQADDNQKYLDMNFDGASGVFTGAGTVFLDAAAEPDFSGPVNFLFGHHMNDGSMFACLSDFADADVFEAHRTVYLLTPTRNYEFRSFAIIRTVGTEALVAHDFSGEADKEEYVQDKESRSLVEPSGGFPAVAGIDKILALSTCDYNESDGRAILFCSLEDEAAPAGGGEVVGDADGYVAPSS